MDAPANSVFSGPITSVFSAVRFDETLFTYQCEKEDKKAVRFQISHFYGSFLSDILAVKRLLLDVGVLSHCRTDFYGAGLCTR